MQIDQMLKPGRLYGATVNNVVWLRVVLIVLGVAYLLQLFSPLRLTSDGIAYLSIAASAADGQGFEQPGEWSNSYPRGYPALLAGLDRAGIAASWSFIALNFLSIALGLVACYFIYRESFKISRWGATLLCCLSLLSFVFVKQATFPMSDLPFFGVAMACLYALTLGERLQGRQRWYILGAAVLLAAAAISIRTIGIALIPALLWACLSKGGPLWERWANGGQERTRLLLAAMTILVVFIAACFLVPSKEYLELGKIYISGMDASMVLNYYMRLKVEELGELIINFPPSKMSHVMAGVVVSVLPYIGLLGLGIVLSGIWRERRRFGVVAVFFLTYALIRFLWHGYAVRYWLPVVPLMMGWAALAMSYTLGLHYGRWIRRALLVYVAWFMLAGMGALAYTSRITFSGSQFPEVYKEGFLRPTYQAAFSGIPASDEVHEKAYKVLLRYEGRAHPALKEGPLQNAKDESSLQ